MNQGAERTSQEETAAEGCEMSFLLPSLRWAPEGNEPTGQKDGDKISQRLWM